MSNLKVAIVEDEPAIRQMYELKFQSAGFQTACAEDGRAGLDLIKSWRPDLILLDLRMPIMDGTEMLRRMRREPWGRNPLVIVLTNLSRSEAPMDLRLLRVDKYLVKAHYTPKQVLEEAEATISRHGLTR
ncbi:MAG TPA: response regulator [Candidatus Saccharimonadales bacterium]|nr:response regulator [Candidatus Saccharimonadales bacterium]